ncbi:MAG: 3-phosphoserine/phosphohydroxythreonine transaminase [Flavobacteriaceae bacterium]|nr:3-phosphoserine/phosphohydroxythreonine transaminase [Flavobacteriaceae bacterium]MCY4266447.1 3-phosphoserine/phosphohydroxythreonine transaminase [Flavobacteriaceae bacterium]MCY4298215.1 3-phosphoserine/phosphohydroxythreonine transaminase [Flavobacteriaceae bacterium]
MKHNFNPGPSILPKSVLEKVSQSIVDLDDSGLSILEISHRSSAFKEVLEKTKHLVLEIAGLSVTDYGVLFLHGGASTQFLNVAANFLNNKAGYSNTGSWSAKAIKEAKHYGQVIEIASSAFSDYSYIPVSFDEDTSTLDYVHITTNNTIYGTQYSEIPETDCPLIADMSSDIFSRTLDYQKFDLFYAGAQKNLGPAGVALVVVKKTLLETVQRQLPSMLDYRLHLTKESSFNTPPVFAIYTTMLNLQWVKENGGLKKLNKKNNQKASLLYSEIDRNAKFRGFANKEDRSHMNVVFNLVDPTEKEIFDHIWESEGIVGLNGHRSVGGYRASIYNALDLKSVDLLVDCMKRFENR